MFDVFRRQQKRWMAALVILAMAAFAFPVTSFMGTPSGRDPESQIEVVGTVFGKEITNVDLMQARQDRMVCNRFVQEMLLAAEPRMAPFIANLNYFGPIESNEAILDAIRLSHKAAQYGIRINDDAIRAWITRMTDGKLSTEQFQAVTASLRLSPQTLFELVRRQLAIQQVEELALGRFARSAQVTPYEAWQFYRRLNEKVGVDVIAVPVSNFTTDVADPSDSELRALYASSIHRLPDPASSEAGFKEPRKVQLQYATAALDPFVLALKPELNVTDEEVKEYYESHKELYRILPSDEKKAESAEPKSEGSKPDEPKLEEPKSDKPAEPKSDESKSDKPAEQNRPAEPKSDEPAKGKEDKGQEKPEPTKEDAPAKDRPKSESKADSDDDVQRDDQEPEGAKADEAKKKPDDADKPDPAKSGETKSDDKPAAPDDPAQPEKKEPAPAAQEESKDQKADGKTDPAKEQPKPDEASAKTESDAAEKDKDSTEKKDDAPKYKPIEEVSDDIRDRLLRQKAREELVRRLEKVQDWVNEFADDAYLPAKNAFDEAKAEEKVAADAKFQPPKAPDLTKQVEELGFKFADTGLVSLDDEVDKISGLGEANELSGDMMSGRTVRSVMDEIDLYDPIVFKNYKDEFFTVWKADDVAAHEPAFDEVRPRVLAAYKAIKARDKARVHADRIAQSLRDAGGDMAKVREAYPGIDPLAVSPVPLWSSAGPLSPNRFMGFGRVEPVQLPGVRFPAEDFHTSLFKSKEGDVVVLANQPRDTYYVVRVAKREPTTYDAFAKSRTLIEEQLQSIRSSENAAQWLTHLRRESSPKKSTAPAGN
jgi:hypothetical protein